MIAGTGSGCGKTTVTLAVLRAMQRRNIPLAAFKWEWKDSGDNGNDESI